MHQARRPVLDEGTGAHIDPWPEPPDPGTGHTNLEAYFEASALLEGEQNFTLPSVDSEQAVTSQIFSFLCLSLVLPPLDTLERDLKTGGGDGEGVDPRQHNAAGRPACLKPSARPSGPHENRQLSTRADLIGRRKACCPSTTRKF